MDHTHSVTCRVAGSCHSDGEVCIISIFKKISQNYLSRLRSINEYLVTD